MTKGSMICDETMFCVASLNIENFNVNWKVSPLSIENYYFFIDTFLLNFQSKLVHKILQKANILL